jgi:hypothetical protein
VIRSGYGALNDEDEGLAESETAMVDAIGC